MLVFHSLELEYHCISKRNFVRYRVDISPTTLNLFIQSVAFSHVNFRIMITS